jgi:hypothetical protein
VAVVELWSTLSFYVFYVVQALAIWQIHRLLLGYQKPFVEVWVDVVTRVQVVERVGVSHQLFGRPACFHGGFVCCLTPIGLFQESQRSGYFLQA